MENLFDRINFGRMVEAKIRRERLNQREAAKLAGTSCSTICRLLDGKAPSVETYLRIKKWIES